MLARHAGWVLTAAALVIVYVDLKADIEELREERAAAPQPVSWQCTGTIPPEAVREAVGRHGRSVFACYEAHGGGARGLLSLELNVAADGLVREGRASGPLSQRAELVSCVQGSLDEWRFPAPTGGDCAVVSAPFLLGAPEGG